MPLTGEGAGLRTDIDAGEFKIVLDAGRSLGGNQSGPSPVQAFISSILACTQVRWPGLPLAAGNALRAGPWRPRCAPAVPVMRAALTLRLHPARAPSALSITARPLGSPVPPQITLQVVAGGHGGGVDVSRIAWTAHAVFDARKLLGDTPTSPRFDRISLHGAVAGGADQATLDELAGEDASHRGAGGDSPWWQAQGQRAASQGVGRRPRVVGGRSSEAGAACPSASHPLPCLQRAPRSAAPSRSRSTPRWCMRWC